MRFLKPEVAGFLAAFLLVLWGYGDTCHYQFSFDDFPGIVNNSALRNFDLRGVLAFSGERILTFLTFAWSWSMFGPDPCAFRIINLVLHVLSSTIAGTCALALYENCGGRPSRRQSYLCIIVAASIFAAHPLQTQGVTYIYQRLTGLTAFFCLLSFFGALRWLASGKEWIRVLSIVAFALAAISKPNSAMLPVLILLTAWFFRPKNIQRCIPWFFPLFAIPVLMRFASDGQSSLASRIAGHSLVGLTWWQYFLTQGRVIWRYIGLMLWPSGQSVDHAVELVRNPLSMGGFIGILGWLFIAIILVAAFRICVSEPDSPKSTNSANSANSAARRMVAFGCLWFFAMLLIESSVIPIRDLMMEHRVYLPFAGAAWAAAGCHLLMMSGLDSLRPTKRVARLALAALAIGFIGLASLTERRNRVWQSSESLWRSVLLTNPGSGRGQLNLGNALLRDGRFDEALLLYESLGRSGALEADAIYQRGLALGLLGRVDEADLAANVLTAKFPGDPMRTDYLRAMVAFVRGDFEGALSRFSSMDDLGGMESAGGPFRRQVRMGIVRACERLLVSREAGEFAKDPRAVKAIWRERSESTLRRILAADALDVEARVRLIRILAASGGAAEVMGLIDDAPASIPYSGAAWLALVKAEIQEDPGKPDAALDEYRNARIRFPHHEGILIWVGSFLATLGDNDRIHQIIGGTREIDSLADHALEQSRKLLGAFQMDEAVSFLRRAVLLCQSGAHKCTRQGRLLQGLGSALILADPDSRGEAEDLISRGKALAPIVPDTGPSP